MVKHIVKKSVVFLVLTCLLFCSLSVSADEEKMGTVNINGLSAEAEGIILEAFEIGYYDGENYVLHSAFEECGVTLDDIGIADSHEVKEISETLSAYAQSHAMANVTETTIDKNGSASMQLPVLDKLYVIAQKDGKTVVKISPFIVLLPYRTLDGEEKITLDASSKVTVGVERCDVVLNKVDEDNKALEGAVFKFEKKEYYMEDFSGKLPSDAEKGTDGSGNYYWKVLSEELTTNAQGQIVIQELLFGNYRFTEVKAPKDFILSKEVINFDVNATGTVKLEGEVYVKDEGEPVILTAVNEREKPSEPSTTPPTNPPTNSPTAPPTNPPTSSSTTPPPGKTVITMDTLTGTVVVIGGIALISLAIVMWVSPKKKKN